MKYDMFAAMPLLRRLWILGYAGHFVCMYENPKKGGWVGCKYTTNTRNLLGTTGHKVNVQLPPVGVWSQCHGVAVVTTQCCYWPYGNMIACFQVPVLLWVSITETNMRWSSNWKPPNLYERLKLYDQSSNNRAETTPHATQWTWQLLL